MAGAGFKTFGVGDVLTASDVNTYLMQQAVMNFADSGARGSAIGTATEGMVSYLADTDTVEVYNGSSWVGVGNGVVAFASASGTATVDYTADGTAVSIAYEPRDSSSTIILEFTARLDILDDSASTVNRYASLSLRQDGVDIDGSGPAVGRELVSASSADAESYVSAYMRAVVAAGSTASRTYSAVVRPPTSVRVKVRGDFYPTRITVTELSPLVVV